MNYLLTGIILLIIFTILIILLVSASYNYLEKQQKLKPDDNILKNQNDDIIFNYIKNVSNSTSRYLKKHKNKIANKSNIINFLSKIYSFLITVFLTVVNFIIVVFEKIKPIKNQKTEIKYDVNEEIEEEELTNDILDKPNVILRSNSKRVKSLKQIQNDKEITKEDFEKLESALLYKIDRTMGDQKFKVALDLANLYGRVGQKKEQKELCKWILEKGSNKYQQTASRMIIGM